MSPSTTHQPPEEHPPSPSPNTTEGDNHLAPEAEPISYSSLPANVQEHLRDAGAAAHGKFVAIKWDALPQDAQAWIREHPLQATCYAVGGGMMLFPLAAATPVLGAVGFGAAGPVAGSLASAAQSIWAPVASGGLFATLQSAAMGGYGAAIVAGTVQAASGVGMAAMGAWNYLRGESWEKGEEGKEDAEKEGEDEDEKSKEGEKKQESCMATAQTEASG